MNYPRGVNKEATRPIGGGIGNGDNKLAQSQKLSLATEARENTNRKLWRSDEESESKQEADNATRLITRSGEVNIKEEYYFF